MAYLHNRQNMHITLPPIENQYVEFKNEQTKASDLAEEMVAFANGEGGEIWASMMVEVERARLNDLDLGQIGDYFTRYQVAFFDEPPTERERLMAATDLLGPTAKPTVAGLLVFGLAPERLLPASGISFAHFAGRELAADLIDKKNIFGPLPRQVDECLAAIKANLVVGSTIVGAKRQEEPHYPDKVFRELLVNACVHRNYSISGSNIRLFLFSDRLEVISPGRLPNTVTIEKLSVGTSFARNPILVRLMENLGYVDKLGRGLPMVWREAKQLGLQVEFEERGAEFRVVLPLPRRESRT